MIIDMYRLAVGAVVIRSCSKRSPPTCCVFLPSEAWCERCDNYFDNYFAQVILHRLFCRGHFASVILRVWFCDRCKWCVCCLHTSSYPGKPPISWTGFTSNHFLLDYILIHWTAGWFEVLPDISVKKIRQTKLRLLFYAKLFCYIALIIWWFSVMVFIVCSCSPNLG